MFYQAYEIYEMCQSGLTTAYKIGILIIYQNLMICLNIDQAIDPTQIPHMDWFGSLNNY